MSLAIEALTEFAFKKTLLHRIDALTVPYNNNSIKLLKKNNFNYEGKLKEYKYHQKKYLDVLIYALINPA